MRALPGERALVVGMAVGSDGLDWIYLNDYKLARLIGTVALIAILYEGGLQTGFQKLRPVLAPAISLAVSPRSDSATLPCASP